MTLTAERVRAIMRDSLYRDEEVPDAGAGVERDSLPEGAVLVEGIVNNYAFHPVRVASHTDEIKELLLELPLPFRMSSGGGWSFLNACMTKDDVQWGEHRDIEQLVALGIATERAAWMPTQRALWPSFPGGMPYVVVLDG